MGSFPNNYQRFPSICALSNDTVAIVWENFKVRFESLKAYKLHIMQDNLILNQNIHYFYDEDFIDDIDNIQFTDEDFIEEIKKKKDKFSNIAEMFLKEIDYLIKN